MTISTDYYMTYDSDPEVLYPGQALDVLYEYDPNYPDETAYAYRVKADSMDVTDLLSEEVMDYITEHVPGWAMQDVAERAQMAAEYRAEAAADEEYLRETR